MSKSTLVLDGESLRSTDIVSFVGDPSRRLQAAPSALKRARASRAYVDAEMRRTVVYGVNTGLGPMAGVVVGRDELEELQLNLIRSHASGAGTIVPAQYVLAAMLVRANTLLKGFSGASPAVIERLILFINHRITPIVPRHGAVGTSGDLVQLAHIALALIGEGEVMYQGKRQPTKTVLKRLRIAPHLTLQAKDGLALINGTSMMTGIAALLINEADKLLARAIDLGALALELVEARDDMLSPVLHHARAHPGQGEIAHQLTLRTRGSKRIISRAHSSEGIEVTDATHQIARSVQEIYSLRCIPQILGPVTDAHRAIREVIDIEINSATDNPLVDPRAGAFLHGGNFHGEYIAEAADRLKEGIVKTTMLSERRLNFFLHAKLNGMFPPFLNLRTPGLTLGLQGLQFVATSTTADSQSLAFPHRIHSIPTNADNQDVVSMGCDAVLIAADTVANAWIVLAIEAIALAQAVDCLAADAGHDHTLRSLSKDGRALYGAIRDASKKVVDDRPLTNDITRVEEKLRQLQ